MQLTGEHVYAVIAINSDSTVEPNITLFDNEIIADRCTMNTITQNTKDMQLFIRKLRFSIASYNI